MLKLGPWELGRPWRTPGGPYPCHQCFNPGNPCTADAIRWSGILDLGARGAVPIVSIPSHNGPPAEPLTLTRFLPEISDFLLLLEPYVGPSSHYRQGSCCFAARGLLVSYQQPRGERLGRSRRYEYWAGDQESRQGG